MTAADTTLAGGSVSGPGALTVTSGTFTWSGGNMAGAGVTTIAAGATGTITASVGLRDTRRMDVGGVLQIAGDYSLGDVDTALLRVLAGGRLRKTATAATGLHRSFVFVPVRNDGVVESLAGNLELFRGANVAEAGTYEGKDADERVVLSGTDHVLGGSARLLDFSEIDGEVTVAPGATLPVSGEIWQTGGPLDRRRRPHRQAALAGRRAGRARDDHGGVRRRHRRRVVLLRDPRRRAHAAQPRHGPARPALRALAGLRRRPAGDREPRPDRDRRHGGGELRRVDRHLRQRAGAQHGHDREARRHGYRARRRHARQRRGAAGQRRQARAHQRRLA